jgi:hypothetical protein
VLDLPPFHFSVEDVERTLLELETNKGAGPDGIPPIILKNCATAFALTDFQQRDVNLRFS